MAVSAGSCGERLAPAGKPDNVNGEAGLFTNLTGDGFGQALAEFHTPAGESVDALRRFARAADEENFSVAKDAGTDGELRPIRGGLRGHWVMMVSTSASSLGPLMTEPA